MAKVKPSGPLQDGDLVTLNKLIRACEETKSYCEKCQRCGLNVDPEYRKNGEQAELARRIKAEFFPNVA